ncbi:hypothetical protein DEO72_LG2g2742 [Vigna unguiculata]|uniref:Uncharacterized protein n=1 Tax=Vigna unguiculata TaxID=3917 RepID=A0A4D6L1R3_VIGUN|nr:hypothetical protein DEO72_LG2g2742 [Vigna unguiculata]
MEGCHVIVFNPSHLSHQNPRQPWKPPLPRSLATAHEVHHELELPYTTITLLRASIAPAFSTPLMSIIVSHGSASFTNLNQKRGASNMLHIIFHHHAHVAASSLAQRRDQRE